MPKHPLSFVEFHNPLFMCGASLGNKLNAAQRGARVLLDDERQVVWIQYKGKIAFVPLASIASADAITVPEDVEALLTAPKADDTFVPPKRGRGRPTQEQLRKEEAAIIRHKVLAAGGSPQVPMPTHDPNDAEAAARHRALVRAASANSNRGNPTGPQNDKLIQESRSIAMGLKHQQTAQVQSAREIAETNGLTGVQGKRKVMSHSEIKAQVEAEKKT